jgi:hypothetical protein
MAALTEKWKKPPSKLRRKSFISFASLSFLSAHSEACFYFPHEDYFVA